MVYFLIPAYEEEGTLGLLLYKIRQVMREIRLVRREKIQVE